MSEAKRLKEVIAGIEQSIARRRRRIAALQAIDFDQQSTDEIIAIVSNPEHFSGTVFEIGMSSDGDWYAEDPDTMYAGRYYATFREALIACVRNEIVDAAHWLEEDIKELRGLGVNVDL